MGSGGFADSDGCIIVRFSIVMSKPRTSAYQYGPSAEPVVSVDASTIAKVKSGCEAQLPAGAASSKSP